MSCINGDEIQIAIHEMEYIFKWLKTIDHEGSNWSVIEHVGDPITKTVDITLEIEKDYSDKF